MHEFSIIKGVIEKISEYAEQNNIKEIKTIHLDIGELQGIVAEHLNFAFNAAKKNTIAEKSELNIR